MITSIRLVQYSEHPVEGIIRYGFSNRDLLNEALLDAGASALRKDIDGDLQGSKRLALLGDTVLQEAVLEPWYSSGESTVMGLSKSYVNNPLHGHSVSCGSGQPGSPSSKVQETWQG